MWGSIGSLSLVSSFTAAQIVEVNVFDQNSGNPQLSLQIHPRVLKALARLLESLYCMKGKLADWPLN